MVLKKPLLASRLSVSCGALCPHCSQSTALVSVPLPILVGCSHSPVTPPLCPPVSGSLSGTSPESGLRVCPSGPLILEPRPLRGPWHLTSSWVWDGYQLCPDSTWTPGATEAGAVQPRFAVWRSLGRQMLPASAAEAGLERRNQPAPFVRLASTP